MRYWCALLVGLALCSQGCGTLPDVRYQPQYHNPFPQLSRVAVLPFYNQSADPTVDQDQVALAYYNQLQTVPGFEVMPVGVAKKIVEGLEVPPQTPADFQMLAQRMGVDAVVVGAITEFSAYYPPRMGLAVNWYAANPCFHPIPPGYGLPWGSSEEKRIPQSTVFDAEFALAREQLKTQTPAAPPPPVKPLGKLLQFEPEAIGTPPPDRAAEPWSGNAPSLAAQSAGGPDLPADWPDPRGLIPPAPSPVRPDCEPHLGPIISHTRMYHGHDEEFTERLAQYYYFRDDARRGGWQSYLQRSEDFISVCCYLHIVDTLAARGGSGKPRLALRWPISRYER